MESFLDSIHSFFSSFHSFFQSEAGKHLTLAMNVNTIAIALLIFCGSFYMLMQRRKATFRFFLAISLMFLVMGTGQLLVRTNSPFLHDIGDLMEIANIIPMVAVFIVLPGWVQESVALAEARKAKIAERDKLPANAWPPAPAAK